MPPQQLCIARAVEKISSFKKKDNYLLYHNIHTISMFVVTILTLFIDFMYILCYNVIVKKLLLLK